jgi:integrase
MLREYRRFLTDKKGQNKRSAIQWYSVLRGFFTANKANLGRYPKFGVQSDPDETGALTQDKVKRMIKSYDDPPERFLIAFFVQSGQRTGVVTAMQRNMVTKIASGHGIVKVPKQFLDPQGKNVNTFERQYSFIVGRDTMQLLHELDKWLLDRHSSYVGGWLFKPSKRTLARNIDNAAQAAHVQEKEHTKIGRWLSEVHPETFRKYWKESMIKAGSNPRCFMHMMGVKVPSTLRNGEPTDEELLEAYMKAEPMLEVL